MLCVIFQAMKSILLQTSVVGSDSFRRCEEICVNEPSTLDCGISQMARWAPKQKLVKMVFAVEPIKGGI